MAITNPYKVKLESYSTGTSTTPTESVVFNVMPTVSESHSVDYQMFDPVHTPGSFMVYRGSKAVTYQISAKFVSRTTSEATQNLTYLNTLRGWTRGYFGFGTAGDTTTLATTMNAAKSSTAGLGTLSPLTTSDLTGVLGIPAPVTYYNSTSNDTTLLGGTTDAAKTAYAKSFLDTMNQNQVNSTLNVQKLSDITGQQVYAQGKKLLGAPPEILYLTAFSSAVASNNVLNMMTNITRIPTVVTAFDFTYPNDCDYIPTGQGQPFPIVLEISISLTEAHSPLELESFDIYKYRNGILPGY